MLWTLMLGHLSARRLAEAIDGPARAGTHAHLARCARCRRLVEQLRDLRRLVAAEPPPEPSPLFWDRFSSRLDEAIGGGVQPAMVSRARWFGWPRLLPASALVIVAASAVGMALWRQVPVAPPPPNRIVAAAPSAMAPSADEAASQEDESWSVLVGLADDVDLDEAAAIGFGPTPGAAERVAGSLSSEERDELVRLIRTEIGAES